MSNRIHGAFINARYSTDNQNPDSIEVQVDKCTQWCHEHNMPILGVFADEATSGMKNSRPQYERMMEHLRLGVADTVVIYDQSRMFRKMTAWFAFRDALTSMGVSVVCVTQPMIGKDLRDPTNFLTEGSMALFNQIWALQSRQKTIEKMRFMARNGQHTGGKPALGYVVEDGRLVVNEAEAAIVKRIFNEYATGNSYKQIIDGLNADGLKTKRGNAFGANSLHDLLHNEKYIGILTYGASPYREDGTRNTHKKDGIDAIRIENAIPPIIDKELFELVQKKMQQNKRQQGGRPPEKRDYPLKGKVYCADCKSAMSVAISHGKYFYYKCSGKKRTHQCEAKPIAVDELENIVIDAVRELLSDPANSNHLLTILKEQREGIQSGAVTTLQNLIAERSSIQAKLNHATDAVLNGLSSPTLAAKITELENQLALVESQMRTLKASVDASALPEERLQEIVDYVVANKNADPRALLSIVYRVEVGADYVHIWTMLDTDPSGTFEEDESGLLITPGITSGVPIKDAVDDTIHCVFYFLLRKGLEGFNRNMPVAYCCSQCKHWVLP